MLSPKRENLLNLVMLTQNLLWPLHAAPRKINATEKHETLQGKIDSENRLKKHLI